MISDFGHGVSGFFRAFGFLLKQRMAWMFLVPLLLWILLAFGMFAFSNWLVALVGEWWTGVLGVTVPVPDHTGWQGFWDDVKSFFSGTGAVVALVVIKVALFLLLALVNKYVVLIVLSPLLAYASELTEERITGRTFPFSLSQLVKDTGRGILIALRNGFLELSITLLVWTVTFFMPLLIPFSVVALFLVSAYFYGFSMFDYAFERRRMRVGESVRSVNRNLGMVLANGALFSLLSKLWIVGLVCVPLMAAVGATLALVEKEGRTGDQPIP